jgi:hypothetical protein
MIEHLFITTDRDERATYTPMGQRHLQLLKEYEARIDRLSKPLYDDCPQFRPVDGTYSPYGVLYGFSSNLLEHMALKALLPDAVTHFSLEDVFADGDADGDKLAWVSGWRQLPHIQPQVAKLFEYPQQFAEDIFTRIERSLRRRVVDGEANATREAGHLFIAPGGDRQDGSNAAPIPDLPSRYFRSSDRQIAAAHAADFIDETQLLHSRQEGEFMISYEAAGGWVAVTKDMLTEVLGAGRDARIVGLPRAAAEALKLMCLDLAAMP